MTLALLVPEIQRGVRGAPPPVTDWPKQPSLNRVKKYIDMLLYDGNIIGASSEIFGNLQKSSVIFGKSPKNVRKRSSYVRNNFGKSSEIFGKWSEIFGKSSKTSSLVCLCNKQNITCPLVDMNFIFSCSTQHLTRSLRSLVRYRVEHSKIKFISTRGHVISSIYPNRTQVRSLHGI